jgi:uncharacterized protein with NRDE domain
MCTVSFIPGKDSFFITSNRDEKLSRKKALVPSAYKTNGGLYLVYPRDADAGGSWIGMKESGEGAVLLNGAFLPHVSQPPYRKSRGLVFLEVLASDRPAHTLEKLNLDNIEPFTIVLLEKKSLYEFRWDGNEKYCRQVPNHRPHIWSSATLYDGLVVKKREQWFAEFLNRHPHPTQQDVINFHRFTGDGDSRNDLLMNRDAVYTTVSITSMQLTADRGSMKYLDLADNQLSEKKIEFISAAETI